VKAGKLIPLGVTGATRSKLLPDVPTIEEAGGLRGYEMSIVYALWAPAGVPQPILAKLSKAVETVVSSSAFKEKLAGDGGEVMNLSTVTESNAYFQKEMQRLSKIVKDGNIKAD
jgi:tripartite-type tricarboxylate transporter receptor subunit TctC